MHPTFTGSSRRPRNVNLSGQASNPFSNTSWTLSAVSNSSKTVSNAQADRERRQVERQRLKAAGKIQRTWRGHRERLALADIRRQEFDHLYTLRSAGPPAQRLPIASNLLLAFFTARRDDDIRRLLLYVRDCRITEIYEIQPADVHPSRTDRLVRILVDGLNRAVTEGPDGAQESSDVFELVARLISAHPRTLSTSADGYYSALAVAFRYQNQNDQSITWLSNMLGAPIEAASSIGLDSVVYKALAFRFLSEKDIRVFEENIYKYSKIIDLHKLASAIIDSYTGSPVAASSDSLLWLVAHYIHLGSAPDCNQNGIDYMEALHVQLASLSSEINIRHRQPADVSGEASSGDMGVPLLDPYVNQQLLSLVSPDGIAKLLRELSNEAVNPPRGKAQQGTSLLAGYTSTLILCFPTHADDIRMRLFLATIPTPDGEIPTIKFLWRDMRQSPLFRKIVTESQRPVDILRNYVHGTPNSPQGEAEEREWRVVLMFLELYIFVLRLSDDDDFFSAVRPDLLQSNQAPSRIRACGLSLDDLKLLSTFLKNAAFALHYRARDITSSRSEMEASASSRLDSYLGSGAQRVSASGPSTVQPVSTRLGLNSLRELMTTAMKMLYERDSRKQFLPAGHWLMTDKLEREDFITAVITEANRQRQEDTENDNADTDEDEEEGSTYVARGRLGARIPAAGTQASAYARLERMRQNQMRAQRERRLAEIGPKLEILKHMPFIVPFETRVKIFRQFINLDREEREGNMGDRVTMTPMGLLMSPAKHTADIRRGQLFEDAFKNFYQLGEGLKDTISITFVDQFGAPEAGIDGGGVTKEFLTSVTTEAFGDTNEDIRMFTSSENSLLYPNPAAIDQLREKLRSQGYTEADAEWREAITNLLRRYEFLGRIVGKCLYEEILLNLSFAGFFLLQWPSTGSGGSSDYKGSVNDLRDMDEDLYKGMLRLKNYPGDVSELGFDFTINDEVSLPNKPVKTVTRNLVPNGDKMLVTNDNRLLYISYVARHRLVQQPSRQTSAFLRGLRQIILPSWLSMFNQMELQRLVGGDSSEIDIEDLRKNTIYSGLYVIGDDQQEHPTIRHFWNVMRGFTDQQRRDVLKYVSSTPRAPLLGFSQLRPKFSIRDAGNDESRLPSTSTCVNLLKLPLYTTEAMLREKLLYAITSGAGFDLS